jgi:hypothetical protein
VARSWGEEALAHYRRVGSEQGVAWTLTTLAVGPIELGRAEAAGPMLEEAGALHRKLGNDGGVRRVLHLQAQQAVGVGDTDRGRRLMRESAELSRRAGDVFGAASSLHSLGDIELGTGAVDAADAAYRDGLRVSWDAGLDRLVCYCLAGLGAVAAERGESERAALVWGFVEAYEERLQFALRGRALYEARMVGLAGTHAYEAGRGRDVSAIVETVLAG